MSTAKRGVLDILLLVGTAVCLVAAGLGSFILSNKWHIPDLWMYGTWLGIGFIGVFGWSLRSRFRHPLFPFFLLAWTAVHIIVVFAVLKFLSFLLVFPFMALELWLGYFLAFCFFGTPPEYKK